MTRVGIDVDGVIADFPETFREFAQQVDEKPYPLPTQWKFWQDWGWTEDYFDQMHWQFAADGWYASELEVIGGQDTLDALWHLRDLGHKVIIVTARHTTEGQQASIEEDTKHWLDTNGVPYDELHFTSDKAAVDVDYFLDDRFGNYVEMLGKTNASFLMDQPWNQKGVCDRIDFDDSHTVTSVAEYVGRVLEYENERDAINLRPESENVNNDTDWEAEREDVLTRFAHELRKATGDGSKKRQSGEKPPWYLDGSHEAALFSHLNKWKHGEKVDSDSGAHPLVHLAWRALAIACTESGNTPDPMC